MQIAVKKFLFLGLKKDRNLFFEKAQKFGQIHFIDPKQGKLPVSNGVVHLLLEAIRVLRGEQIVDQIEIEEFSQALLIAKQILEKKRRLEEHREEIRTLKLDIERIRPFGNFDLNEIKFIEQKGRRVIQFFASKESMRKQLEKDPHLIFIATEDALDYYLSISDQPKTYDGLIEMKIEHTLVEQKVALERTQEEMEKIEHELQQQAKYNQALHKALTLSINQMNLEHAEKGAYSLLDDSLFAATGWIPENKIQELNRLTDQLTIYKDELDKEANETAPTYLENEALSRIGEDLIHIYDTPSSTDKDPSLWVLFAFLLFFAIIVGDGGYGSVFLGLALYLRYKFPQWKGVKKRVLNLFTLLCLATITWGVLSSSFFGISLRPDHPLRAFSLTSYLVEKKIAYHKNLNDETYLSWVKEYPQIQAENTPSEIALNAVSESETLLFQLSDQVLLELALLIGIVHVILGMARYSLRNWSNFGWILFLIGAYLYIPVYLGTPTLAHYLFHIPFEKGGEVGKYLMLTGIPGAVFLAIFRNGLIGLTEIMNLIQVFADVLSYLRLYALGLSGAILSSTINSMASKMPFIIAIFLIVAGHLVNMALGVMGGIIHGLRLNFLEWYHYSFEGGGKKFKPLELKKVD